MNAESCYCRKWWNRSGLTGLSIRRDCNYIIFLVGAKEEGGKVCRVCTNPWREKKNETGGWVRNRLVPVKGWHCHCCKPSSRCYKARIEQSHLVDFFGLSVVWSIVKPSPPSHWVNIDLFHLYPKQTHTQSISYYTLNAVLSIYELCYLEPRKLNLLCVRSILRYSPISIVHWVTGSLTSIVLYSKQIIPNHFVLNVSSIHRVHT